MKPLGVRTTPFSKWQPSSSPDWLSGCSTSSQNFAALVEDVVDQIGRQIGELRQVALFLHLQEFVEHEAVIFDAGRDRSAFSNPSGFLKRTLGTLFPSVDHVPARSSFRAGSRAGNSALNQIA